MKTQAAPYRPMNQVLRKRSGQLFLRVGAVYGLFSAFAFAQPSWGTAPKEEAIKPTWETQTQAQTCFFEVPAPRGQIVDRNGLPLAQTKLGYHLELNFPNGGKKFSDVEVVNYVHQYLVQAQKLLHRPVEISTKEVLDHYKYRRKVPLDIATYLKAKDVEKFKSEVAAPFSLRPIYMRSYPNGDTAAHVIGYVGKTGAAPHGPLVPHELLWPNLTGREGLELSFNDQLTGVDGSINVTYDNQGNKISERVVTAPIPGKTVVTTLDLQLQQLCEQALAKHTKRGAFVVMDPNTGDVLALASWPTFNPNLFVPAISDKDFDRLNTDPENPLIPRAYRSSYPAGSAFKIVVGAAALQSQTISKDDTFEGPPSIRLGNVVMHNWKKVPTGPLNFVEALAQSCNTWFFEVGIKTGVERIVQWGEMFGFGQATGLPLRNEDRGVMPDNDYMLRKYKRRMLEGDVANLAIGQGDLLVTPIQMAQAMSTLANGGTFYQTRLVQQVQTAANEVVTGYPVQPRRSIGLSPDVYNTIKQAMIAVVEAGTAHKAQVDGIEIAGKTGTAQWGGNGNASKERKAAWFVGFAPADKPQYAFAVLYESEPGERAHGGDKAAPMVAQVLGEAMKTQIAQEKKRIKRAREERKRRELANEALKRDLNLDQDEDLSD